MNALRLDTTLLKTLKKCLAMLIAVVMILTIMPNLAKADDAATPGTTMTDPDETPPDDEGEIGAAAALGAPFSVATRGVTVSLGDNMSPHADSGTLVQEVEDGEAIDPIIIEPDAGYILPDAVPGDLKGLIYAAATSGVTASDNAKVIYGVPAGDVDVTIPDAIEDTFDGVVYVKDTGDDTTGTGSLSKPYKTIKGAYASLGTGTVEAEIRVLSDIEEPGQIRMVSGESGRPSSAVITIQSYDVAGQIPLTTGQHTIKATGKATGTSGSPYGEAGMFVISGD